MIIKSVGILVFLLMVIFILFSTVGIGITGYIFAFIFLIEAILFTIKPNYYDKYKRIISTTFYRFYNEKDKELYYFYRNNEKIRNC